MTNGLLSVVRQGRGCVLLVASAWALAACSSQGTVRFQISEPALYSPFADPRYQSIELVDEASGMQLGQSVAGLGGMRSAPIGDIHAGTYDLQMSVTGGAQLLGMARAHVVLQPGNEQTVALDARKPLAYFGALRQLTSLAPPILPTPKPLMLLDATLPQDVALPPVGLPGQTSASIGTPDGQHVLVAAGSQLLLVETSGQTVEQMAALPGGTQVYDLAVSPDGASAAVATDKGVGIVSLANLAAPDIAQVSSPRRVIFSPDGATVLALSAPSWEQVACGMGQSSQVFAIAVADPTTATPMDVGAKSVVTDFVFDAAGALVLATPCESGTTSSGSTHLPGAGIFSLTHLGPGVAGVPSKLQVDMAHPTVDPGDPNVVIYPVYGQLEVSDPPQSTPFLITPDRVLIDVDQSNGNVIELRADPASIIAYEIAASPDGSHVVIADRTHYDIPKTRYVSTGTLDCTVQIVRNINHLTIVDSHTGAVGFRTVYGLEDVPGPSNDTGCTLECSDNIGPFPPSPCYQDNGGNGFALADGFIPSGLSILLGDR